MTKDDVIRMAREAGFADAEGVVHPAYQLEAFAAVVSTRAAAHEREACAKVAEQFEPDEKTSYVMYASKAIRARGNT
jgi:hypothetical protein